VLRWPQLSLSCYSRGRLLVHRGHRQPLRTSPKSALTAAATTSISAGSPGTT
jgi:hypothetical protein